MTAFHPLRSLPTAAGYGAGDVLVIFGEVFGRGYANGLIDAAQALGMKVIYGTVGRRDEGGALRGLTDAEMAEKGHGPIINVPLEAGFDKVPSPNGESLMDMLNALGKDWENAQLDFSAIEAARAAGAEDFKARTAAFLEDLKSHIPAGAKVLMAHTMAGGIPASKRVLAVSNRIFKGTGARFQPSKAFWDSPMGRACAISFNEVTAHTLEHLIDVSAGMRAEMEAGGGQMNYVAYGYHGTECMIDGSYTWQTYAPYLQGFAKMKLEDIAADAHQQGVKVGVFNAPEILTNSSGIFVGVELPLYRLLLAIEAEAGDAVMADKVRAICAQKLTDGLAGLDEIRQILRTYHNAPQIAYLREFSTWPQHNTAEQMDLMIACAAQLRALHHDGNDLITGDLSKLVFEACGQIMLHQSQNLDAPVYWLGHDIIAKSLCQTGLSD